MSFKVSSAESSPRNLKGRVSRDSPTHINSRPAAHSSALHSAWIQRIIPSNPRKDPEFDPGAGINRMELQEDGDEDLEVNKSGSPFFTASETLLRTGPPSASSDAKIVPVSDNPPEQTFGHEAEEFHVKIPETLGSSAWFSRITKKEGEPMKKKLVDEHDESPKSIRAFPPLKSGEQWPGTQKPFNLPPLRIPGSKDAQAPEPHHLPYLTPVNVASPEKQNSETSITKSLPSNFLVELESKRNKIPQRIHSTDSVNGAASVSDTESLSPACWHASDEGDSESVKKMRQKMRAFATGTGTGTGPALERSFSRIVSEPIEKSNRGGQSPHIIPPHRKQQEQDARRMPEPPPRHSKAAHENLRPVQLQVRGSQQWLQRWCTPKSPPDVNKLH